MSVSRTNARIVLPVADYATVIRGVRLDRVLYANNCEEIDQDHPVLERFQTVSETLKIFRDGTSMIKGTTTSTGWFIRTSPTFSALRSTERYTKCLPSDFSPLSLQAVSSWDSSGHGSGFRARRRKVQRRLHVTSFNSSREMADGRSARELSTRWQSCRSRHFGCGCTPPGEQ